MKLVLKTMIVLGIIELAAYAVLFVVGYYAADYMGYLPDDTSRILKCVIEKKT